MSVILSQRCGLCLRWSNLICGEAEVGGGRREGGQTAVGHLKPLGCWERQEEGGGRGWESGESRGAGRRERDAFAWSLGAAGPCPAPGAAAACSLRQRLQLGLVAAKASLCSARVTGELYPRAFRMLLPSSLNQSPSGSPFLTCFPPYDFFFFFGSEVLESHLEPGACY